MDEIRMFKILRPAPPAAADETSRAVGYRLDQALAPAPPAVPARGRRTRPALVGGLSLAFMVSAAAIAVAGHVGSVPVAGDGGSRHASSISVRELAYRTAAVAAAGPDAGPGQWLYWKEKQLGGRPDGIFQVWTTADARRAAYVDDKGKVRFASGCDDGTAQSPRNCHFIGQPAVFTLPGGGTVSSAVAGTIPVSYVGLRVLPHTPDALVAFLGRLRFPHWEGWGPAPVREFKIIDEMLTTYVMPPPLTAEFYRALAHIPGVTLDDHAVDVAGRPGVGLSIAIPSAMGGGIDEIIINPRTHQLAGQQLRADGHDGSAGRVLSGTAILQSGFAAGPGELP